MTLSAPTNPRFAFFSSLLAREQLLETEAGRDVVLHQTAGLHERVADGRTDESEPLRLQGLAHGLGLRGLGGDVAESLEPTHERLATDERPQERVERPVLALHLAHSGRVAHG